MRRAFGLAAFALLAGCQGQGAEQAAAPEPTATLSTSSSVDPAIAMRSADQKQVGATACPADESPIFACKFKDGKRVTVCGAGEWSGRYRFGGATPEIAINGGRYASVMYSGGGEAQIAFDNGDTRYIVFSRVVRTGFGDEGNKPAISDGIVIERAGKYQSIRICDDPDVKPIDMNAANVIWEDQRELFTDETIRADIPENE